MFRDAELDEGVQRRCVEYAGQPLEQDLHRQSHPIVRAVATAAIVLPARSSFTSSAGVIPMVFAASLTPARRRRRRTTGRTAFFVAVAETVGVVVGIDGPLLDAAPATETPATPRTAATE